MNYLLPLQTLQALHFQQLPSCLPIMPSRHALSWGLNPYADHPACLHTMSCHEVFPHWARPHESTWRETSGDAMRSWRAAGKIEKVNASSGGVARTLEDFRLGRQNLHS